MIRADDREFRRTARRSARSSFIAAPEAMASGRGLMRAIEELARAEGHWLLVLDTTTGTDAERLYWRLGWTQFGEVPNHALTADGLLFDTTDFFKDRRDRRG